MKKTAITAAVLVALGAAGYVGASWYIGQQIEQHWDAESERALSLLGTPEVVSHSYRRGLFGSLSTTVVELELPQEPFDAHDPAAPAAGAGQPAATRKVRLHLEDRVRHGPLPGLRTVAAATVESRLIRVEGIDDAWRQAFAKASAPYLDTVVGFDGGYRTRLTLPAGEFAQARTRAQWQQLEATFHGSDQSARIDGELRWPQAGLESATAAAPVRFAFENLQGRFSVEAPQQQDTEQWLLADGTVKARVGRVTVARGTGVGGPNTAAAPLLTLADVELDSHSKRDAALLDTALRIDAHGSAGTTPIEAIRFETTLERLDVDALGTLQALLAESETDPADAAAQQEIASSVQENLEQLLAARPEYRSRLTATVNGQAGELGYRLATRELDERDAAAAAAAPTNALPALLQAALLPRLEGEAALRVPKNWVPLLAGVLGGPALPPQSIAPVLSGLVAQRLLQEDAQAYHAELRLARGNATLNGRPMPGFVPGR